MNPTSFKSLFQEKDLASIHYFWAVQRPLGSMFAVLWYEMSYENVLRRFGDFCTVVDPVLYMAQRLNINPCFNWHQVCDLTVEFS